MSLEGATTDKLNLRAEPAARGAIVRVLAKGEPVRLLERSDDGKWSRVYAVGVGLVGWVYDKYVEWEAEEPLGELVGRTTANLNLRNKPTTGSKTIVVLTKGVEVRKLDESADGRWSNVREPSAGVEGWAYNRYIDWVAAEGPAVLPLRSIRNVHSWPTYNLGLSYDKQTGLLKSGNWLIKRNEVSPEDVWAGTARTYPWKGPTGNGEYHGAADIVPDPGGTNPPVLAAFPGEVVKLNKKGPFENNILIWTENDEISFLSIYQHLAPKFEVKTGDVVVPGREIGRLGEWAGNEHLHFELISPTALPGVAKKWGVPCKSGQTANSQFRDSVFDKWVKLPYFMYNVIKVVDAYNKRYG